MNSLKTMLIWLCLAVAPNFASATLIYDQWVSNEGDTGNYIITVNQAADTFMVEVTVNPWNAEALAIFIDWGDVDIADTTLTNGLPVGEVNLFATDTTSNSCGGGCNLNGLIAPIADPDGEWEWVINLGQQGFDSIQTFSFDLAANGLTLDDWGLIGMRSQQLCTGGALLPGGADTGACDGSDKSYSTNGVAEPGTLVLLGAGLLGLGLRRRRS